MTALTKVIFVSISCLICVTACRAGNGAGSGSAWDLEPLPVARDDNVRSLFERFADSSDVAVVRVVACQDDGVEVEVQQVIKGSTRPSSREHVGELSCDRVRWVTPDRGYLGETAVLFARRHESRLTPIPSIDGSYHPWVFTQDVGELKQIVEALTAFASLEGDPEPRVRRKLLGDLLRSRNLYAREGAMTYIFTAKMEEEFADDLFGILASRSSDLLSRRGAGTSLANLLMRRRKKTTLPFDPDDPLHDRYVKTLVELAEDPPGAGVTKADIAAYAMVNLAAIRSAMTEDWPRVAPRDTCGMVASQTNPGCLLEWYAREGAATARRWRSWYEAGDHRGASSGH